MNGWRHLGALALTLTLVLAACSKAPAPAGTGTSGTGATPGTGTTNAAAPAPKPAPDKVTFRTDAPASGYIAPFAVALKKGFYQDENLEATLGEGRGSSTTVQLVANGSETFGLADFGTAMQTIAKGAPVKGVAIISQLSPLAVLSHSDKSLTKPSQLEGMKIGLVAGGAAAQMIQPFMEANGVNKAKVEIVNVDRAANAQVFLDRKVDAMVGWVNYEVPVLKAKGANVTAMMFAQHGVNTLSLAILASDDTIKNKPQVVERFVRASLKGWEYALAHPEEAVDILAGMFENVDKGVSLGQLQNTRQLLHTDRTKDKPLGWAAPEDVTASEQILAKYAGLTAIGNPNAYYTNQFIPTK